MPNQQRINEFRRKLRSGDQAVRIVNGEVSLAKDASAKPRDPSAKPQPGVKVKPHEWGGARSAGTGARL